MEWKILTLNEVKANNNTFRIDAEFFKKEYLKVLKLIKKNNFEFLDAITDWITQGPNPIFSETGTPCLTGRNINKGEVAYNNSDYVDQGEYQRLKGYQIKKGDTLITLKGKGSIGKIGYVFKNKKSIFSRDIGVIRPNKINPAYLNVFIQCKYGKKIIDRGETGGTGQSTLTTSYLKAITIPRLKLETQIGDLLNEAELLKQQSNTVYLKAHNLLLSAHGLTNWQPKHQLTFVKNYSDLQEAERIDAEYYQPKYDEIVKSIKGYTGGWDLLGNRVNLKDTIFNPKDKTKYKYIELANISGNGEITDCMIEEGKDLPSRARRKVATDDVIVSSIEGSLSSIALIESDYNQALCSTGFHVVNSNTFNSETLLVLLKSIVGQLQFKKGCSGTILTAINKDEFNKIILPLVKRIVQNKIQQKITESFKLRKRSKNLLECAKRAVEMAIEKSEDKAEKWLNKKMREVNTK